MAHCLVSTFKYLHTENDAAECLRRVAACAAVTKPADLLFLAGTTDPFSPLEGVCSPKTHAILALMRLDFLSVARLGPTRRLSRKWMPSQ
jgi:hypothetical protein